MNATTQVWTAATAAGNVVGTLCSKCRRPIAPGDKILDRPIYKLGELHYIELFHEHCEDPTMSQAQIGKAFILAGHAIFTIVGKTARYTYKVNRKDPSPDDPRPQKYFLSLMTGSDNESSYSYVGILDPASGGVRTTRNSKINDEHPAVVGIRWALRHVWATGKLPSGELLHAGKCGRCGRTLTDPESIASGIGPDCREKMSC